MKTAVQIAEGRKSSAMYAGRPHVLLERGWIAFRSSTWIPVVTGFVEPVLFLLAFGYGMGTLVGDITTGNTTIDYTLFIAPGLLANSAMNGAIYDSTWNVFWKCTFTKLNITTFCIIHTLRFTKLLRQHCCNREKKKFCCIHFQK